MKKKGLVFDCPSCGIKLFVVDSADETTIVCEKCGVWMHCNGKEERELKYKGKNAGDKA